MSTADIHPAILGNLTVLSERLAVTARLLSPTKFLLELPYCMEILKWQLSFARAGSHLVPDFIFCTSSPDDFSPLQGRSPALSSHLQNWNEDRRDMLTLVVQALLGQVRLQPYPWHVSANDDLH